jgi:GDP-L-fucose synthase
LNLNKSSKIYIAGHNGMVGSACWNILKDNGYNNLIGKSFKELDLRDQKKVEEFISIEKPEIIIDAAAKVGGILANNSYPYDFIMDNLLIQNNLLKSSHENEISKFIFLGSSCIYPKLCPQPIKEEYLLTDSLEKTNEWYAIAKISGLKVIESLRIQFNRDYISLMPTNLYGPNDNFDLLSSHVLPAMIRKFHEAKESNNSTVTLWGSGNPMREFLYVNDLASAVLFSIENRLTESVYNVGCGVDISIKDLAFKIQKIVGHTGSIIWDKTKPDGTPKKLLDVSKINNLGWKSSVSLDEGIEKTYHWFKKKYT